jgi:hypothetical protein
MTWLEGAKKNITTKQMTYLRPEKQQHRQAHLHLYGNATRKYKQSQSASDIISMTTAQ